MQQGTRLHSQSYTVFEFKETCDNATVKVDSEEERVRHQLDEIISRIDVIDKLYATCVARYQGGITDGIFDQISSLTANKRDLEMQRSILTDRMCAVRDRITSENKQSEGKRIRYIQPRVFIPIVIPRIEVWSIEVYEHTNARTLNKRKFVSPITVLGGSASGEWGKYNYTYFNDQTIEEVQVIDHNPVIEPVVENVSRPTFPIPLDGGRPKSSTDNSARSTSVIHINDILDRTANTRHVIIIRGLPGSGKTLFCQSFKDAELSHGRSAPRILSIDQYFTAEEGQYEYDAAMEAVYGQELFKMFRRQIDDGLFPVILVDSINDRVDQFSQFYHYARIHGYQPAVLELKVSPTICAKRSEAKMQPAEVYQLADNWEETPSNFMKLDATSFLQDSSIEDVEMEDIEVDNNEDSADQEDGNSGSDDDDDDEITASGFFKSKWDEDFQETKERLDGTKQLGHEHNVFNLNDFLKLEEESLYKTSGNNKDNNGKDKDEKKVKWADFEELKRQKKRKQLGFVAGYTDWNKIMSDDIVVAESALVQVRYFVKDNA